MRVAADFAAVDFHRSVGHADEKAEGPGHEDLEHVTDTPLGAIA